MVLQTRLKVPPAVNQFYSHLDRQTGVVEVSSIRLHWPAARLNVLPWRSGQQLLHSKQVAMTASCWLLAALDRAMTAPQGRECRVVVTVVSFSIILFWYWPCILQPPSSSSCWTSTGLRPSRPRRRGWEREPPPGLRGRRTPPARELPWWDTVLTPSPLSWRRRRLSSLSSLTMLTLLRWVDDTWLLKWCSWTFSPDN